MIGFFPSCLFSLGLANVVESTTNCLFFLSLDTLIVSKASGVHVFDVMARMLEDSKFKRKPPTGLEFLDQFRVLFLESCDTVRQYVEQWTIDLKQLGEIERKMEEVAWSIALIYGVGSLTLAGAKPNLFTCVIILCDEEVNYVS